MFHVVANAAAHGAPPAWLTGAYRRVRCVFGYIRDMFWRCLHLWLVLFGFVLVYGRCTSLSNRKPTEKTGVFANPDVYKLSQEIAASPEKASLYYDRGKTLKKYGADSLALKDFIQASRLDSTKAAYFSAVGDLLFEHKDIDGSVRWLEQALKRNPEDPTARLKIAKLHLYIREYNRALLEINTVLRLDAYNTEGYFLKGMIRKDLKDTNNAISSFQTVLQIDPTHRDASLQLGQLYGAQHNPLGLKYYDNAFNLDTSDVFPLFAKGMYYQQENAYEEAKQYYRDCIHRDRLYADAYHNLGFILMQQDSFVAALRQFDLTLTVEPNNADAVYNKGLANELLGHKEEAIMAYRRTLQLYKNYEEARTGLERLGAKP